MSSPFQTIALFGSTGHLGAFFLQALLDPPNSSYKPTIRTFVRPSEKEEFENLPKDERIEVVVSELKDEAEMVEKLKGVDAVVSVLNGPGIEAQYEILEAAVKAGVKRFIPSEFGSHHTYRPPSSSVHYNPAFTSLTHAMWDSKAKFNEYLTLHAAIDEGTLSYTIIGCGDFYNQAWEPFWCPWADVGKVKSQSEVVVPVVGDAEAKAEFSHIGDVAKYTAALLSRDPNISENKTLNFPSHTVSQAHWAELMEKYSPTPVKRQTFSLDEAHGIIADPDSAPEELKSTSPFPPDFWFIVKSAQGEGRFRRPKGEVHKELFPEVEVLGLEEYFEEQFGSRKV
ncbi:NAD(P)-binding protein [Saitoella complicata NRRL Y-17804]|uniref:NmrA-like domain-containing protein n=1 Tax=Saitoella complicata (strain BCRC 22490 / CBS 7301 / JCM 7358 / NBRC 10748 / NRRL Y-17804) TaxID=698492 RepID=A0A0E9NMQ4_SAICN|nr:NAD(P)-binding protein [Saitoella complicata NRRL Y-17804]ODQ53536.1 NAD(P)-binding protein [Saitoella complicata NRRL Y-17804]GAO51083.1 hypothetical protein G7K_5195-t1 [Saitoella complicata NRRL Y-17804]